MQYFTLGASIFPLYHSSSLMTSVVTPSLYGYREFSWINTKKRLLFCRNCSVWPSAVTNRFGETGCCSAQCIVLILHALLRSANVHRNLNDSFHTNRFRWRKYSPLIGFYLISPSTSSLDCAFTKLLSFWYPLASYGISVRMGRRQ